MAVIGEKDHVAWFRGRETIDGYGEADLKEFLSLETVAEFPDATLYRMPPPDDSMKRTASTEQLDDGVGPRVSKFLEDTGADAAPWADSSGMLYHFRNLRLNSIVWSNHVQSLPSPRVAVPRFAEVWGLDSWPRWGWRFDPLSKTLVNLVGFVALLAVPLWFWFARRGRCIEIVFVMLPALYLHAVYAVASHFIPRYAQPEIPLRILAVLLLVCLVASSLRRLGGRRPPAKRPSPPAAPRTAGLRTQGRGGSLSARLRRKAGRW